MIQMPSFLSRHCRCRPQHPFTTPFSLVARACRGLGHTAVCASTIVGRPCSTARGLDARMRLGPETDVRPDEPIRHETSVPTNTTLRRRAPVSSPLGLEFSSHAGTQSFSELC